MTRYSLGVLVALGLMLAPGPWMNAQAGTLAQLQLQASAAKLRSTISSGHMDLCVGVARTANCRVAFETALRTATQGSSARGRLYEVFAARRANIASEIDSQHQIVLKFNGDPEWKRRAKVMAHDGLPFIRMPEGGNHELIVGITPHGTLGFSLKDTTGE